MGEELSFSIKTGLKNIIGKDLITDEYIAVFELVKNSYDAHAQKVTIVFEDNMIIISDDGKGMSKPDLENKWFAVAYSAKKDVAKIRTTMKPKKMRAMTIMMKIAGNHIEIK